MRCVCVCVCVPELLRNCYCTALSPVFVVCVCVCVRAWAARVRDDGSWRERFGVFVEIEAFPLLIHHVSIPGVC